MLPDAGVGARVPVAEQLLDAPDQTGLLIQAAARNYEGPISRPGLLLEFLQAPRAEVDALGPEESVGAALHDPDSTRGGGGSPAAPGILPAVTAEVLLQGD